MNHAAKLVGEAGMSRDERSMLLGSGGDAAGPDQQLLGVLNTVREAAQAVLDGRAKRFWADECMNQLILGVEVALGQGWGEIVDAFTDAGRILQSYENGGKPGQAAPYIVEAYDILCALVGDAFSGAATPAIAGQWRARYQKEVAQLERSGFELVNDEFDANSEDSADAFAFPDLSSKIVRLRPQDDLPTLDELPPLDSMLGNASAAKAQPQAQRQRVDATPPTARLDAARVARVEEARAQQAAEAVEKAAPPAPTRTTVQPSRIMVEFVDRICEELGGLPQRSEDERVLSMEMIQGGVAALKREAMKDGFATSAELCDEMLKACMFISQDGAPVDELFTDLAFGFCGIYVEAMGNPASENVSAWRVECNGLLEEWLEIATRPEAPALVAQPVAPPVATVEMLEVQDVIEDESVDAQSAEDDGIWIGSGAEPRAEEAAIQEAPQLMAEVARPAPEPEPIRAVAPAPRIEAPVAEAPAPFIRSAVLPSADLFVRAQEALARGDGEAAKGLALQAAAMIAESEVDKAEYLLRTAEAKLKANVTAIEEARGDVKNTEKSVMNAASEVAAGETVLGQVKSQTAKVAHDLQESEAEVADIERQLAELQARLAAQQADVANVSGKLEEAKSIEAQSENQLLGLRDHEKDVRKELEAARQRVKDRQRVSGEIESEMDRAREMLSRQRTSLSDIKQTINRPEPIKTGGVGSTDPLLF